MRSLLFSPSLMSADLLNLAKSLEDVAPVSDMLHFDIMDGHFAPNLTLAPDTVKAVRPATSLPLDAHLMVTTPERYLDQLIAAGADYITLHAETIVANSFRTINMLHERGVKVGIALNPATPVEFAKEYLPLVDMVTVMTVDIGYGGQKLIPQMLRKISALVDFRAASGAKYIIQADGGVNENTCEEIAAAGADALVIGRGLFRTDMPIEESVARWKALRGER